jgi:hypothetical protein
MKEPVEMERAQTGSSGRLFEGYIRAEVGLHQRGCPLKAALLSFQIPSVRQPRVAL